MDQQQQPDGNQQQVLIEKLADPHLRANWLFTGIRNGRRVLSDALERLDAERDAELCARITTQIERFDETIEMVDKAERARIDDELE
jgi:hypothetical protein